MTWLILTLALLAWPDWQVWRWELARTGNVSAISGLTRCKIRLIGEIVRSQYHSCTELPQKKRADIIS